MKKVFAGKIERSAASTTPAIVFGVLLRDAQEEWPSRNQLLLALSHHTPVVLLESRHNHERMPTPTIERISHNVYVMHSALALRTSRFGRRFGRFAARLDGAWFHRNLQSVGISKYIYWLTVADPVLALGVPSRSLIYDCADPNFLPNRQADFDIAEYQIATRAALTLSTAHSLQKRMSVFNPKSFLLPNATGRDFHPQSTADLPRPHSLEGRYGPIVGYLGTVDWRFDPTFVFAAAKALPELTFAIVGRINDDQSDQIAALRRLPNVVMPGQVGYSEGRAWVAAFDIGIIPFKISETNDNINSVKMYMYLMAGLPVVATAVEECRRNDFVSTASTPDEFIQLIRQSTASSSTHDCQQRINFALRNTWEVRACEAIGLLRQNGLFPTADEQKDSRQE